MFEMALSRTGEWLRAVFNSEDAIQVSGVFRGFGKPTTSTVDLFELRDFRAHTVRITLPMKAPTNGQPNKACAFQSHGPDWWGTWASVLATMGLVAPIVDPKRLADLVNDSRRIKFCCDTNALCGGVATWLLLVLGDRIDIVTSAVVDRELAAWPDRANDFWSPKTLDSWSLRTHYRLARRVIESPPAGVVIDRLAPEQGALMLAKWRDENQGKSPDCDVLLVELARGLIRDQPRNARVLFLTGDRNNARTATGALGAENVMFAVADSRRAERAAGKVVARGWWRPDGPLGAVNIYSTERMLWDLLAACDTLKLSSSRGAWLLTVATSVPGGVPSDWADPWLKIQEVQRSPGAAPAPAPASAPGQAPAPASAPGQAPAPAPDFAPALVPEVDSVQPHAPAPEGSPEPSEVASVNVLGDSPNATPPKATLDVWLLPPPRKHRVLHNVAASLRPIPKIFFYLLGTALGADLSATPITGSEEIVAEVGRILTALGATSASGGPGPHVRQYRDNWILENHDWFHAQMYRLPGYRAALSELQEHGSEGMNTRTQVQISMARALGQAARLERVGNNVIIGDAPLRTRVLQDALDHWLPNVGDALGTDELCRRAASELHLTPARFEKAMMRLWATAADVPFEGRSGGTVVPGFVEHVIALGALQLQFRPVAPGDLSFGRAAPVRVIMRAR